MAGGLTGDAERAAAAVRAVDRAGDATTAAVALLHQADDLDWTGPGAVAYRDALTVVLDGVLRARLRLREAEQAAAEHLVAVRVEEEQAAVAARAAGLPDPRSDLLGVPVVGGRREVPGDRGAAP